MYCLNFIQSSMYIYVSIEHISHYSIIKYVSCEHISSYSIIFCVYASIEHISQYSIIIYVSASIHVLIHRKILTNFEHINQYCYICFLRTYKSHYIISIDMFPSNLFNYCLYVSIEHISTYLISHQPYI